MNKRDVERLANQILVDIAQLNPHHQQDKNLAFLWAAGYLAGYIAQMSSEDPFVYKRLKRQIDRQLQKRRLK